MERVFNNEIGVWLLGIRELFLGVCNMIMWACFHGLGKYLCRAQPLKIWQRWSTVLGPEYLSELFGI